MSKLKLAVAAAIALASSGSSIGTPRIEQVHYKKDENKRRRAGHKKFKAQCAARRLQRRLQHG